MRPIDKEKIIEVLQTIVFYNGHAEWMLPLAEILEERDRFYTCGETDIIWGTEEHFIWMLLCGLFGDWGTSIRSGWIENTKEAAEFIRMICELDGEEDAAD